MLWKGVRSLYATVGKLRHTGHGISGAPGAWITLESDKVPDTKNTLYSSQRTVLECYVIIESSLDHMSSPEPSICRQNKGQQLIC